MYLGSLRDSASDAAGIIGGVVTGSVVFVFLLVLLLTGLYVVKRRSTSKIYYPIHQNVNDG